MVRWLAPKPFQRPERGRTIATWGRNVEVRYHLDADTWQPHIYGHGVIEAEVEYILRHPGEDRPGPDGSRHALGQTAAGRYLRVIYVPDEGVERVFVVTAYDLRGKPLQAYRRRRKKRRK